MTEEEKKLAEQAALEAEQKAKNEADEAEKKAQEEAEAKALAEKEAAEKRFAERPSPQNGKAAARYRRQAPGTCCGQSQD